MTNSERKNKILEFVLGQEYPVGWFTIYENLFPESSENEIVNLFKQIEEYYPTVAKVNTSPDCESIFYNHNTKSFLEKGGFLAGDKKTELTELKEKAELESAIWSGKLAKSSFNKRWLFVAIPILLAVIGYIYQVLQSQNKPQRKELKGQQQHITDSISTSNPTKMEDSLNVTTLKKDSISSK